MKKFELITNDTIMIEDVTLYRVKSLRDFADIRQGDLGGYIERESNLSHEGCCWVAGNAHVFGDATVSGNAVVDGNAEVFGNAMISGDAHVTEHCHIFDDAVVRDDAVVSGHASVSSDARIWDNATITSNASVYGHAVIREHATVTGDAHVCGISNIFGDATISGNVVIDGNAEVFGDADIHGFATVGGECRIQLGADVSDPNDVLCLGPIGSRNNYTTFYRVEGGINVTCGCFNDSIEAFRKEVLRTHSTVSPYRKQYLAAIKAAKIIMG